MTHARDEDDAVRARGMRVLAETAVGREMDGFEEVDADDGVRASVAAKSKNAAAAGDDQRAVVIARGALADGRRVVVVVTRDFRVGCFDDGLRELWRREDAAPTGRARRRRPSSSRRRAWRSGTAVWGSSARD